MDEKKYYNHDGIWQQRADQSQPLWGAYSPIVYREILELLTQFRAAPAQVLDVGCGAGALGMSVDQAGYSYTGVDESQVAIDLGGKYFPSLKLRRADFASPHCLQDFSDRFDVILSVNSLHCLVEGEDRQNFLKNMRAIGRDGESILILTTMSLPALAHHRLSTSPRLLLASEQIIAEIQSCGWGKMLYHKLQPASDKAPIANLSVIFQNSD